MRTIFHRFRCPFCFSQATLGGAKFICTNEARFCPPVIDDIHAKFYDVPGQLRQRIFTAAEGAEKKGSKATGLGKLLAAFRALKGKVLAPISGYCPSCEKESMDMVCPACHSKLPYRTGHHEDLMLGVIGAKEVGKSHYIAVLLKLIQEQMTRDFPCSLSPANDETPRRYRRDFCEHLFVNGRTIPETLPASQGGTVKEPLIYYLSFRGRNFVTRVLQALGQRKQSANDVVKVVTLEFFDTAGENLNAEDTLNRENRYIMYSQGLVLLLDPLQLPGVRRQLVGKVSLPNQNAENHDLIDRVWRLIVTELRLPLQGPKSQIDIPLAVAFSKSDAIESLLTAGNIIQRDSWNKGAYDLTEFATINREIEMLIEQWEPNLVSKIKQKFKNVGFFAVSALGCSPDSARNIPELRPRRVLDPYLWLLAKNKAIPTTGTEEPAEVIE